MATKTASGIDIKSHEGPVRFAFKNGDRSWHGCVFTVHSIHGDLVILNFVEDGPGWVSTDKPLTIRASEVTFYDAAYYLTDWREANAEQQRRRAERKSQSEAAALSGASK